MDFMLRKDSREWFKGIRDDKGGRVAARLDLDFDIFYFCFVAGVLRGRKLDLPSSETTALVENFPGQYKTRGRLLVALFLSQELVGCLGVDLGARNEVYAEVSAMLRHDAQNFLSDQGVRELNKYAHGGFQVLLDELEDQPQSLDSFLIEFWEKVCG